MRAYDEAESEPRVLLDHMGRIIATIMAPADNAFVAFDLFAESVLSAGEYQTHGVVWV